jgi:methylated-DNA-[protein]-cysteine S-methyltransferase
VSTYGDLAAAIGSPGAARAVGSVMARNCFPLIVPCHRVLGAGGSLGGYSAPDGLRMKRRLLAMEGQQALAFDI